MKGERRLADTPELQTDKFKLQPGNLQILLDKLREKGYTPIGPTLRDKAIVYDELLSVWDLPSGWTAVHDAGSYRVEKRDDHAFFGYAVGQLSLKNFLHPSGAGLWEASRKGSGFQIASGNGEVPKFAFVGIRPCDLHAMKRHDAIFLEGDYVDEIYRANRENALFVVVNCTDPSSTCFCASMKTGPRATEGYDLALTEVIKEKSHFFLCEVGSQVGRELIEQIPHDVATDEEINASETRLGEAEGLMGRVLDTSGLKEALYRAYEHQHWNIVADKCLSCGNCTMVCPTCFCNTLLDAADLKVDNAKRFRKWDSCYSVDFAYIHGGSTRPTPRARYRQWLTHKLASWEDQFGMSGCVGCGRCITWCPVGIDLTQEVQSLRGLEAVCKTCTPSREKSFEAKKRMLLDFPLINEIGDKYIDILTQHSSIVRFNPGEAIFQVGEDADRFYLIRHGVVAIETYVPERGPILVQTIGEGEMLGWSWSIPPYKAHFDARAVELTRAISIEAEPIRKLCEEDQEFGYRINQYISQIIGQRMEATRMQLLDVFTE